MQLSHFWGYRANNFFNSMSWAEDTSPKVCKTHKAGSFSDNLGSWPNGIKLGKAKGGGYSKFRYLQFNNFAISTLFRA
jgi:hypothetical protein